MTTLYYSPGAASMVVHWLLIELQAPHELHPLDLEAREHKSAEYLVINPAGVVPTLVIEGKPVAEAAAISLHLADAYSQGNLAPAPGTADRASYYQWMFFLANTMQPAFRTWFYPAEVSGEANSEASKARARERIEAGWDRLAVHLSNAGPYLLGEKVCAVDFMLCMLMRWSRNMPKPATAWPALDAHARLLKARPSFAQLYAREGLSDWA